MTDADRMPPQITARKDPPHNAIVSHSPHTPTKQPPHSHIQVTVDATDRPTGLWYRPPARVTLHAACTHLLPSDVCRTWPVLCAQQHQQSAPRVFTFRTWLSPDTRAHPGPLITPSQQYTARIWDKCVRLSCIAAGMGFPMVNPCVCVPPHRWSGCAPRPPRPQCRPRRSAGPARPSFSTLPWPVGR